MSVANTVKIEEMFKKYDTNGDGKITRQEFTALFKVIDGEKWDNERADRLFNCADTDKSNYLSVQEFLNWVFRKPRGRAVAKAVAHKQLEERSQSTGGIMDLAKTAPPGFDTDTETSSSESSSSDSNDEEAAKRKAARGHRQPRKKKRHRAKKLVVSDLVLYELLTNEGGCVGPRLELGEFVDLFYNASQQGLDAELARTVPQDIGHLGGDRSMESEDLSPFEVGLLYQMLHEDPKLQSGTRKERLEAALQLVRENCEKCRSDLEYTGPPSLELVGLDHTSPIGWGVFQDLLALIADLMLLDVDHVLACFFNTHAETFEITDAIATRIMESLFLKVAKKGETILEQHIKSNDFMRMCHVQELSDAVTPSGIPHARLTLLFGSTLQGLPRLLRERDERRGAVRKKAIKDKPHHHHKSISGRIKLGILFDELYKALPVGSYKSRLKMVLSMLDIADSLKATNTLKH
mmetsp:Transcript_14121/g.30675  ORF Transcript_14121/g.30675 Transcript_14121/m.30675 type:complete len:464 (+) Transcript_14121:203-1594(+)|eukprot:CAMPEP_0206463400 /NCGR_PEP_ID=MMETSP0324_2-20121206/26577_1 /ASSEMBLY_ACC=CAM_ASM_000836 /TAXON_ID=2866 /ORGANISM="Crypthecodinium cohnii, Strain Seligo" /LENGTH=463 /DNA_ID=CAMNT_0053935791 /DNA_START=267 /DNA_END=1658 /DNA_ORIENTATION=-